MRSYETILVLKPQLSDEQVAEFLDKTKKLITDNGGELQAEDKWGRRKLSFPVQKAREGFYAYFKFKAPSPALEKLNHHFRVADSVLRTGTFSAHVAKEPPKKKAKAPKPAAAQA
jgi:small subunit ribosomal protein S6